MGFRCWRAARGRPDAKGCKGNIWCGSRAQVVRPARHSGFTGRAKSRHLVRVNVHQAGSPFRLHRTREKPTSRPGQRASGRLAIPASPDSQKTDISSGEAGTSSRVVPVASAGG
jgi:hypothetical protein